MTRTFLIAALISAPLATGALAASPDRIEDRIDRIENRIDRRVDRGPSDRIEDRFDRREDRVDRRITRGDGRFTRAERRLLRRVAE